MKKREFKVNNQEVQRALKAMKVGQVAVVVRQWTSTTFRNNHERYRLITKVSPNLFKSEWSPCVDISTDDKVDLEFEPSCFTDQKGICTLNDICNYDATKNIKTQLLGVL